MSSTDLVMGAAGGSGGDATYVEDVFSTYLYTGTGAAQTITNGIDLAGEGGMVWIKDRSVARNNELQDTARGAGYRLQSNLTNASSLTSGTISSFNSDGFSTTTTNTNYNGSGETYASWTFRKAPKFFDVVTYTGTGSARTVAHNLGSVPGMIFIKRTDSSADGEWQVYHRSISNTQYLILNNYTSGTNANRWNSTTATTIGFSLGTSATVNSSGGTYVAYIFAHNAGGFGESGTDDVISCGTFTTDGSSNATVNLGWEPQFVLIKDLEDNQYFQMFDNMRGLNSDKTKSAVLYPGTTNAESVSEVCSINATGFVAGQYASTPYIYMAIRRPMKVPTTGTEVFARVARTGTGANATVSSGFVTDTVIQGNRGTVTAGDKFGVWNRLRGTGYNLTTTTAAEVAAGTTIIQANPWDVMNGYKVGTTSTLTNASSNTFINWMFKRATGFHDVVCYTGNATAGRTVAHNLGVAPEMMIIKNRDGGTGPWTVYHKFSSSTPEDTFLTLNTTAAAVTTTNGAYWNRTNPTSSVFTLFSSNVNDPVNYVALLFASLPGVSKVGSYTGNGSTQTINCGFTSGARFVLIKNTASGPNWFVWDTARGIVDGASPWLALNTLVPDNTPPLSVAPNSAGFIVQQSSAVNLNVNGSTYLYLAIA